MKAAVLAALCGIWSVAAAAQQRDTTARPPQPTDSLKVYTLPPAVVSVTRANPPINRIPQAVQLVEQPAISRARPTWGLDEALVGVLASLAGAFEQFPLLDCRLCWTRGHDPVQSRQAAPPKVIAALKIRPRRPDKASCCL